MTDMIGIAGLLLAIVFLMYYVCKGMSVVVMTIICTILIAFTNGMKPVETFTNIYMGRFGSMIGMLGAIFIFGALIGSIYDSSGAAYSLVKFFTAHIKTEKKKLKTLVSVFCIMVITVGLGYFGVDTLVLIFLTLPICTQFCRQYDWSEKFVPVLVLSGPLANIMPGAVQNHNIIPTKFLGTHPMASAIPGFLACAVGFILILIYTTKAIEKSVAAGEVFRENDALKHAAIPREKYPHPLAAFFPLLTIFVCFNVCNQKIEVSLFIGVIAALLFLGKYVTDIYQILDQGISNAARTIINFGALMGFASVSMSAPVFTDWCRKLAENNTIYPVLMIVIATALLTSVGNSGTSGITAFMEKFAQIFLEKGVPAEIIHRAATLTGATLDTLPTNSGVIIAINLAGSTHKESYKYICVNTVIIPSIVVAIYMFLISLFPEIAV